MVWPILSSFVVEFAYHASQCLMYSFHGTVGLWMVRHSPHFLDVQVVAHLLQDVVAKFLPLVRHQASWKTVVAEILVI